MQVLKEVVEKIYSFEDGRTINDGLKEVSSKGTVIQKLLKCKYKDKILYFKKSNVFWNDNKEEVAFSRINEKFENIEKYVGFINENGEKYYRDLN